MSSVLISNNKYIKKWNILEGSIKPNVIHYNNISTIKDLNFKERNKVLSLALLWDNVGNKCRIPFLDTMKITEKKKKPEPRKKTKKIRGSNNFYATRRKCLKYNKKTTRKKSDKYLDPINIIDKLRSWPSIRKDVSKKITRFHKIIENNDYTEKAKKYYSDDLLKIIKLYSDKKTNFTLDLISCNMNHPEFIRQTKLIEKNSKLKSLIQLMKLVTLDKVWEIGYKNRIKLA